MSDPRPDLAIPAGPNALRFPLAPGSRTLRLYPGTAGEVRVYWRLPADLLMPYRAWFPTADGPLTVVLRLLRLGTDGTAGICNERRLTLRRLGGADEAAFAVGDDPGPFQAELGLINPQGGWLLLSRSNRLLHARSIGLERLRPPPAGLELEEVASGLSATRTSPATEGGGLIHEPLPQSAAILDASLDPSPLADSNNLSVFGYGSPTAAATGLVIETELRIWGWGPPNTEIDLFGHPYRIGPGGRFQLSIRLDDPELIRQLLAHQTLPGGWR